MGFPQSNIDWSKYMKGLEGKANGKFAVVEAKTNPDGSWYRKWSDGWLEQGGVLNAPQPASVTVNLLKPFANTLYSVSYSASTALDAGGYNMGLTSKQTTKFVCQGTFSDSSRNWLSWYACGQGA